MAEIITITANWSTGSLSNSVISRQYDNNRYRIQFMGYPEDSAEDLLYYLLVWMRTDETPQGAMLAPIQMDSDQWLISNYFTQMEQQIRFQMCIQNESGTFEAHSPIFNGAILGSLKHDGEDIDIDTSALFDYYREYVNNLIIESGAVVIDAALDETSTNPVQNKIVAGAITGLNGRLQSFAGETEVVSDAADWEQGQFTTTDGNAISAPNRIRTKELGLPQNVYTVNAINGYKFLAYAWSDTEYLGIWTGSGFNKTSASGLIITSMDVNAARTLGATKVRIVLMRATASEAILPAEGVNLIYTAYENDINIVKKDVAAVEDFVDDVKVSYQTGNIYQVRTDELTGRYYYRNSGTLKNGANSAYMAFIVPVIPGRVYTFTQSNIVLLDADKNLVETAGGNYDFSEVRNCYSGDAHYFAISVKLTNIPESGYVISMGDALDDSTYSKTVYANPAPGKKVLGSSMISGPLEYGEEHIITGKFGSRDGYYVVFRGTFSTFGTVTLKYNGTNVTNSISVNSENIVIVSGIGNAITQAHGLTIADEMSVLLELKNSVMYITVESGGSKYTYNCPWMWTGSTPSEIGVSASGMSFDDTKLSMRVASAQRNIWYFGDSYAEFNTNARLPYYMAEYGFDKNVMFNSISGSGSAAANIAFTTLLAYGNPKYAINALGMNDGSDSDNNTPNATWLTNIQTFITMCERHDIIPVLCTIPSIPTVKNEGKSAWVRASGYRYIDMAAAVGADANGHWYTGMLGNDNIHPSATGAVAQFMQLLSDMPEVM